MKRFIAVMLLIICVTVVRAGDKEVWQAKRAKLVEDQEQMNLTYTVFIREVDAVLKYIAECEVKKADMKKKKKKVKKSKKAKKSKKIKVDGEKDMEKGGKK